MDKIIKLPKFIGPIIPNKLLPKNFNKNHKGNKNLKRINISKELMKGKIDGIK